MPVSNDLLSALNLTEDPEDDEAVDAAINALLTSAVKDQSPDIDLTKIFVAIDKYKAASHLDPLNALPLLIPSTHPVAQDLIDLIGESASAKEVLMAVHEALERLEYALVSDENAEEKEGSDGETSATSFDQLQAIIRLCAKSLPRLQLRRKTASETLVQWLDAINKVSNISANKLEGAQGRMLLKLLDLVKDVWKWVEIVKVSQSDLSDCRVYLHRFLDDSVVAYIPHMKMSLAQRALEEKIPRLRSRSPAQPDTETGKDIMKEILLTYEFLHIPPPTATGTPSTIDLIWAAHYGTHDDNPQVTLSHFIPILVFSLQSNNLVDQSLAIIIRSLGILDTSASGYVLPSNISVPLWSVVPHIASVHTNPDIRHQSFRVLYQLITLADPMVTFQNLVELTQNSEYPQMRVASVGLVKEALLQASNRPSQKNNPFTTSLFLRSFGPILFRTNPPDLLESPNLTLADFQETSEPQRLTECLSLYYVVLQRDKTNNTGIRDISTMKSVESNLITPLKRHLDTWSSEASAQTGHFHTIAPLVSLGISLDRVREAQALLFVSSAT